MELLLRLVLVPAAALGFGWAQVGTADAVDEAADRLRSDAVYVEPGAEDVIDAGDADRLRDLIRDEGTRVFIAVLTTASADDAGGPEDAAASIGRTVRIDGTYVVATEDDIAALSSTLPEGGAADLLAEVQDVEGDDPFAVLAGFVERVDDAERAARGEGTDGRSESDGDGGGGSSLMPVLLVGGAVAGGAFLLTQSRKNRRQQAEMRQRLQGAQQDLLAELSVLSDDVLRLEPEVATHPEARADYEAAVSRYRWLEAAIPQIDSPDDPPRIQRAMTEARYAMARVEAIVRGLEPPPPPAELTERGRYGEPAIEIDEEDEYRRPRYAGYGGGWYGGGFFGGNGLFTGLLLGHMLGGGFGGWGGGWGGDGDGDSGGDFDGGDFGGGDFGGGDFGGGDFGGGDF